MTRRNRHKNKTKKAQNKYKLVALMLALLVVSNMSDAKSSREHKRTCWDHVVLWINMYINI